MNNKDPLIDFLKQNEIKNVSSARQVGEIYKKYDTMQNSVQREKMPPQVINNNSTNVYGDIINSNINSPHASINIKNDLDKLKELLLASSEIKEQDKTQMAEFASFFVDALKSDKPIEKGSASKFSSLVHTYLNTLINTIGQPLLTVLLAWITTK